MASVVPGAEAEASTTRRMKMWLKDSDWGVLELTAMDEGRSLSGEVAYLLRQMIHAARRGSELNPSDLQCWLKDGQLMVSPR